MLSTSHNYFNHFIVFSQRLHVALTVFKLHCKQFAIITSFSLYQTVPNCSYNIYINKGKEKQEVIWTSILYNTAMWYQNSQMNPKILVLKYEQDLWIWWDLTSWLHHAVWQRWKHFTDVIKVPSSVGFFLVFKYI